MNALPRPAWPAALRILRPFTLLPPAVGLLAGAAAALGSGGDPAAGLAAAAPAALLAALAVATLNGASNVLNQICERDLDARNKPERVLPAGAMRLASAWWYCGLLYAVAALLGIAAAGLAGRSEPLLWLLLISVFTLLYSLPPFYTKSRGWLGNLTIAIPRGGLIKLLGWSCVAPAITSYEAWLVAGVFAIFVLGSASTKDFADAEGDAAAGCRTLVVIHGPERVARWLRWFFVLPWPLLALAAIFPSSEPIVHAPAWAMALLALVLMGYGAWTANLLHDSARRAHEGNHPAWTHMYLLMMLAQIGLAAVYLGAHWQLTAIPKEVSP